MEAGKRNLLKNPKEKANILSVLFFGWTVKLFKRGYSEDFSEEHLFNPLTSDRSDNLGDRLEKTWNREILKAKASNGSPSLLKAIIKTFPLDLLKIVFCGIIFDFVGRLTQPYLLGQLLLYFKPGSEVTKEDAYLYAGGLVITSFINGFIQHYPCIAMHLGMKVRVACCSLLYRKSLRLSQAALGNSATGKIVNLLSNDVARFDLVFAFLNCIWIPPIMTICIVSLVWIDAGPSGLLGVAVIFIVVPLQSYLSNLTARYRSQIAYKTDERVRLMDEIMSGIRIIKMYAWENPFAYIVKQARRAEIKVIRKTSYLRGIFMSFNICTMKLTVYAMMISLYVFSDNISADKVFMYTAYYNLLSQSVAMIFVRGIVEIAEAYVSVQRLKDYLLQEEITESSSHYITDDSQTTKQVSETQTNQKEVGTLSLVNANAKWNSTYSDNTLKNINLHMKKGQLVAVVGQVGCGKSSLLQAILGELPFSSGTCSISGKLSYACQEPWVFAATVRQNILFGKPYDKKRYEEVVRVCALRRDLDLLPRGDLTLVGERGSSLSGGQKARVNLARAVYSQADIYLLDDPLSAVDTHVGKHLFEECIQSFLCDKSRILVTHQLQYLKNADCIIILNNGEIQMKGTFQELVESQIDYAALLGVDEETKEGEDKEESATEEEQKYPKLSRVLRQISRMSTTSKSSKSSTAVEEVKEESKPPVHQLEETSKGKLQKSTYIEYFQAGTNWFGILVMVLLFLLTQILASAADYWVSFWTMQEEARTYYESHNFTSDEIDTTQILPLESLLSSEMCFYIFSALLAILLIITFSRSFYFYGMAMKASENLHNDMLDRILRTRVRFFDVNPSGRILNRFSKDMGSVDELLPKAILDATQLILVCLGSLALAVAVNYYFIVAIVILGTVLLFIRMVYLKTSKNVKRLEGITKSPVFTHLNATLQGLSTIRAFQVENVLKEEFDRHQDIHTSVFFMFIMTTSAFGLFLDMLCFIYIAVVTMSFLFLEDEMGGNVGLVITQSMMLVGLMQYGIRQSAEVANNMMSVERVLEYKYLEEEPMIKENKRNKPPKDWPYKGKIEFEDMYLAYSENDIPVLKDLNFVIQPGQKVGIVGRTGAGKSSLIAALFRLAPIEGSIKIDDIDTKNISLPYLRTKISIIPQDPVLFSGTLRRNLDPFNEFKDKNLWDALESVELKDVIKDLNGLDTSIAERGNNFSVGQRQLICLARAILRNNKILMLDEATANVDPQTDGLIQKTIRLKFSQCTVLTVAHRLNTIMDSDKVVVMDAGKIVEFNHPHILLQNVNGYFYRMVQQTGPNIAEQLKKIALQHYRGSELWGKLRDLINPSIDDIEKS